MKVYSAILFLHVMATLGVVGAMSFEMIALRQLRGAWNRVSAQPWLDLVPRARILATVCLMTLLLSGGYLTDRLAMWKLAWPKVAVLVVIAFGALAGLSGSRFGRIRRALQDPSSNEDDAVRQANGAFLKLSLRLRAGLVMAAVFLMTMKPDLKLSLGGTAACILICWLIGLSGAQKLDLNRQPGPNVKKRAHQQSI
jgi:hypothetical protein